MSLATRSFQDLSNPYNTDPLISFSYKLDEKERKALPGLLLPSLDVWMAGVRSPLSARRSEELRSARCDLELRAVRSSASRTEAPHRRARRPLEARLRRKSSQLRDAMVTVSLENAI